MMCKVTLLLAKKVKGTKSANVWLALYVASLNFGGALALTSM